jgi:hypothetical protein
MGLYTAADLTPLPAQAGRWDVVSSAPVDYEALAQQARSSTPAPKWQLLSSSTTQRGRILEVGSGAVRNADSAKQAQVAFEEVVLEVMLVLALGGGLLWVLKTGRKTNSQTPQGTAASLAGGPPYGGQPGTAVAVGAVRQGNATAQGSPEAAPPGKTNRQLPGQADAVSALRQNLLCKVLGNESVCNRLIDFEKETHTNASYEELIGRAIERWERDNR